MSRRGRAAQVGTYLGPRSFYTKDMAKKTRAGQHEVPLPPRCVHCRVSWNTVMIDSQPHCQAHSHLDGCPKD